MKTNVIAAKLSGMGRLTKLDDSPVSVGKLTLYWQSDRLNNQEIVLGCYFVKHEVTVPAMLIQKALDTHSDVVVSFEAELIGVEEVFYGQTPECPQCILHLSANLKKLSVIGTCAQADQTNVLESKAA